MYDAVVTIIFGSQVLDVYVDDIPSDATDHEIRDMAWDILEMNSYMVIDKIERN